jgi:hypothetical protein
MNVLVRAEPRERLRTAIEESTLAVAKFQKLSDERETGVKLIDNLRANIETLEQDVGQRTANFAGEAMRAGTISSFQLPKNIVKDQAEVAALKTRLELSIKGLRVIEHELSEANTAKARTQEALVASTLPLIQSEADLIASECERLEKLLQVQQWRLQTLSHAGVAETNFQLNGRALAALRRSGPAPQANSKEAATWLGYKKAWLEYRKQLLTNADVQPDFKD